MQRQSGFTLIELVVVIVILGILAAFAVPRFVGMQSEARSSTVEGLKGSIQGAASLAHGKALAVGLNSTQNLNSTHVTGLDGDVEMVQGRVPGANMDGIAKMMQDELGGFLNTEDDGYDDHFLDNFNNGGLITFYPQGVEDGDNCAVSYGAEEDNDQVNYAVNATTDDC